MAKRLVRALIATVVVLAVGFFVAQYFVDRAANRQVDRLISRLPAGTTVSYGSIKGSLIGDKVRMRDIKLNTPETGPAKIDRIVLASFDPLNTVPHYVKMQVRGFEMRADRASANTRSMMRRLGYDRIVVDVDYAYRYDAGRRTLIVEKARISGQQVGTLELTGRFDNVPSIEINSYSALIAVAMQSVVRRVRIVYDDASLADRIMKAQAKSDGKPEAEVRNELLARLDGELRKSKSAQYRRELQHLRAFVQKPGRLVIEANPKRPIPVFLIAAAGEPDSIRRLLGIKLRLQPRKAN